MQEQEIIPYYSHEGQVVNVFLDVENDTVWLTQKQMSVLFDTTSRNIGMHIANIYKEKELEKLSTKKDFFQVQTEGSREVRRTIDIYNLDMIISVGYRIKSKCGIAFRQWASKILKEYLIKGYAIRRPVSRQELDDVREKLEQQIKNLQITSGAQFNEVYESLAQLTKLLTTPDPKPRKPIGYRTKNQQEEENKCGEYENNSNL
jgi:hypothetical protein